MKYLHFIVNPISGKGNHVIGEVLLKNYFPGGEYKIVLEFTEYKKHAEELAKMALLQKPDCIVACGGDGTINEVASAIVGTDIKLGIIPVGSGNGLASNLEIPQHIEKAVAIIKAEKTASIDVGKINGHYFFSNMGLGIDAMIIDKYEKSKKRTLLSYVKASLSASLEYKPTECQVAVNGKTITANPFLLFISNSNEMGYKMSLTPSASLSDGLLDMVVVPQLSFLEKLQLGYSVFRNNVQRFEKASHQLFRECIIDMPLRIFAEVQIDGEFHKLKTNRISVSIIEKGLKVIIPSHKN